MTVTAHDIATALRDRLPGLPTMKLHKLLYYCQGIHLAHCGEPLFEETISAWDMGPVVGTLWREETNGVEPPSPRELTNAQLGTVGYVVSRYGALSGTDLSVLTHNEDPWRRGDEERKKRGQQRAKIRLEWLAEFFTAARDEDEDESHLDDEAVRQWLAGATRPTTPAEPDTREALAAWARGA